VGAAVLTSGGACFPGCNIELEFRLGMHAEVNALSSMLAAQPSGVPVGLLIAADRPSFGPCGSCLDWIVQLNPGCVITHEDKPGHAVSVRAARDYLPHYPR
jgi:cytidine deaminase